LKNMKKLLPCWHRRLFVDFSISFAVTRSSVLFFCSIHPHTDFFPLCQAFRDHLEFNFEDNVELKLNYRLAKSSGT
jgi:hypothetical protein